MMITSAFTCTGPYAILVMLGIKRVENRSARPVPEKGRCAVSCSKSFSREVYANFVLWAAHNLPTEDFGRLPAWGDVKDWPGKVVGCCDYAVRAAREPYRGAARERWDEGYPFWWDLSEVVSFDEPIPCRGNVGMWQLPDDLARRVTAADALAQCAGASVATAADAERLFRMALPIAGNNEGVFVLPLDAERRALAAPLLVSLGTTTTSVVQPGEIFAAALRQNAAAVIVAHNHPSGDPTPSVQDRALTAALARLGDQLGVKLLDHLIVGASGCISALA